MTPAKMFDGDLWTLASDAVAMAENAYKKGQTDEREACAKVCDRMAARCNDIRAAALESAAENIRAREQA